MNELIFLSYADEEMEIAQTISAALKEQGYKVWNDNSMQGYMGWDRKTKKIMSLCNGLLILIPTAENISRWMKQELDFAQEYNIPIIPISISNTPTNVILEYPLETSVIAISSNENQEVHLETLFETLKTLFHNASLSTYQLIENEIEQFRQHFPELHSTLIVSIDGQRHPFSIISNLDNFERMREEDRASAMSAGSFSLSERIASEMALGNLSINIVKGLSATFFNFSILNTDWNFVIVIKGQPSIDAVLDYFRSQDFFAHLLPLL